MKNKILGLIVCMLLLASAVLPVIGISETLNHENVEINTTENHEISSASYLEEQEDGVWINITPAINYVGGTLTRRQLCKMVFDTNSECVILFSGSVLENTYEDTWAYNYANNTWFNRTVVNGPKGRKYYAMTYNSQADRTIIFSGREPGAYLNDTSAYDFSTNTWTNMTALPTYSEVNGTLSPRRRHAMAYDSAADRVILFGGDNHAPDSLGDTWVYDFNNNTWYNMTPTVTVIDGPMPSGGIYAHSMVYDEANDLTVLFGGYADPGAASTFRINWTYVYYYDNNTWVNRTPSMTVIGGNLIPRSSPSMVYDSNAECAVMFGGRRSGTQDDILNETWLYKASDNTWYYVNYRTSNDDILWGRYWLGAAYDSINSKTIIFGGYNNNDPPNWPTPYSNETWVFKHNIENEPPNTPTDPDPANGSLYVDIDADLSWYCWDLDFDDLTYDVYFEADDTTPDELVSNNQSEKTYDPESMDYNETYYWQIVAWDTEDQSTAGPVWHFTTEGPNNAPNTPSDPDPADEETNVSLEADLSWTGGDPDPGDTVTYDVYFEADDSTPDVKVSSNQTDTTYDPGTMSVNTQYYWQIIAWDNDGETAEGPVWSFNTITNDPPNTPYDPEPEDGATDVDINADLSWDCSDPDGDDLTYDVYFEADDSTPDELVSNNQSETTYDPGTMDYNTHYYWRIIAWDPYTYTEGPVWDFTTGSDPNNPPYTPSNPDPENDSTNVDIEADLSWTGGDPDGDPVVYDVYLEANDPTPDDKVADDITETTFDPGTMDYETVYYWRIIAKDNHGASTWGPIWHFTTELAPMPDLNCEGSLSWSNVKPEETVEGSFTVKNIGDPGSLLDWEVAEYPEWGTWNFMPSSGEDLKPEDGAVTVQVTCIAPDGKNEEFTGSIRIINSENASDYCTINVSLSTPKNKLFIHNFPLISWLFERFPNMFPILRQLIGL